ncbi:hypothetical protein BJ508DRAFT_414479 [Ascobolus immersus RN42]|uniref:ERCC4 domain-containing protein n=1 Tax=Ascobolus immersus RN42 TaxID=1160509 RepID=A0A3N4IJF4_ASCIM|nr:hypothetical protein BJ508DRAFT_414479 [Ascobolus immersus RN42]
MQCVSAVADSCSSNKSPMVNLLLSYPAFLGVREDQLRLIPISTSQFIPRYRLDVIKSLAFSGNSTLHEVRITLPPQVRRWQGLLHSCIRECERALGYELKLQLRSGSPALIASSRFKKSSKSTVQYISDIRTLHVLLKASFAIPISLLNYWLRCIWKHHYVYRQVDPAYTSWVTSNAAQSLFQLTRITSASFHTNSKYDCIQRVLDGSSPTSNPTLIFATKEMSRQLWKFIVRTELLRRIGYCTAPSVVCSSFPLFLGAEFHKPKYGGKYGSFSSAEKASNAGQKLGCKAIVSKFTPIQCNHSIVIHGPGSGGYCELLLKEMKPEQVVFTTPQLETIRKYEGFASDNFTRVQRCYLTLSQDSFEEVSFLSILRGERDAFNNYITANKRESRTLVPSSGATKGGKGTVIIDVREFRSSLPYALMSAFRLLPARLGVSDFILSDTTCVERKSFEDLNKSLLTGRLFRQCLSMRKSFARNILLIEVCDCSEGCAICGQHSAMRRSLVRLILEFPELGLLWSSSKVQTVSFFLTIKKREAEPELQPSPMQTNVLGNVPKDLALTDVFSCLRSLTLSSRGGAALNFSAW